MDPLIVLLLFLFAGWFIRMAFKLLFAAVIMSGLIAFGLGICLTLAALMAAGFVRF